MQRYLNRVSGPLLDRIDLHVEVTPVPFDDLSAKRYTEDSASVRERVQKARFIQDQRFAHSKTVFCNARMRSRMVQEVCGIDQSGRNLLKNAMDRLGFSARAYDRILKVARTIADLEEETLIKTVHLAEAIQYRSLDREDWAG